MTLKPQSETVIVLSLVLISVALAPLSVTAVCLAQLIGRLKALVTAWKIHIRQTTPKPKTRRTILVTGVGMAKGLTLARAFTQYGHRVVGADFETTYGPIFIPCSGRFSNSLSVFHRLPQPEGNTYIGFLLKLIRTERVDLWVSCSGVASATDDALAKEAIEAETSCRCVQFDVAATERLHKKDAFMRFAREVGVSVPETYDVTDPEQVLEKLYGCGGKAGFILKPAGVDDANRANMTLLPLATRSETNDYVRGLKGAMSPDRPWILQRFVPGGQEFCTHALVVRGKVRCFVACRSADMLMHYEALSRVEDNNSGLARAMLDYTRVLVARSPNSKAMTGHLSLDFMLAEDWVHDETSCCGLGLLQRRFYAIECNPRTHTAVVLFADQNSAETENMVQAYLSSLDEEASVTEKLVQPKVNVTPRYWLGHDLVTLVLQPAFRFTTGCSSFSELAHGCVEGLSHVLLWKEGTFEWWDPLPALVLYHLYWPLTLLSAWWGGRRWSKLNVSTTKMFMC